MGGLAKQLRSILSEGQEIDDDELVERLASLNLKLSGPLAKMPSYLKVINDELGQADYSLQLLAKGEKYAPQKGNLIAALRKIQQTTRVALRRVEKVESIEDDGDLLDESAIAGLTNAQRRALPNGFDLAVFIENAEHDLSQIRSGIQGFVKVQEGDARSRWKLAGRVMSGLASLQGESKRYYNKVGHSFDKMPKE